MLAAAAEAVCCRPPGRCLMSEPSAQLDHIQITSDDPERLARFYQGAMGMVAGRVDREMWLCTAPDRRVLVARGRPRTLGFGAYRCESAEALATLRARLERGGVALAAARSPLLAPGGFAISDPDGNTLLFGLANPGSGTPPAGASLRARLQHVVVATEDPESLVQFYADVVGLPISDKVLRDGAITACWLRTDRAHHSLAIFRTRDPERRLDHHSYEVDSWSLVRDWADHFARQRLGLTWGPGRHGPGNNLFIMVDDPDGNWIEISAELEVVEDGRPVGIWPHEERTFNRWAQASVRR